MDRKIKDLFDVSSSLELSKITESDKRDYFESVYTEYSSCYHGLNRDSLDIKEYFSWIDKKLNINFVYFKKRNKQSEIFCFFTYTSDNKDGNTIIYDLLNIDLPMDILVYDGLLHSDILLAKLIEGNYIKDIKLSDVSSKYPVVQHHISGNSFFDIEYKSFTENLEEGYPNISFSEIKLYKKIYDFDEIIHEVNNQQFEHELLECLYAYERGKFFICAAGMGSVLEHLIYLATYKHVIEGKDENGNQRIIIDENSTANEYIAQLGRHPFDANKRDKTLLKSIFANRNSVSHYNKGHFSKVMCDRLLEGLTIVFHKYYMYGK